MNVFQGEYCVEFANGGICLPRKFARVFGKYPSDKLTLFEIEVDDYCPVIKGQWGLAELGTENKLGHFMKIYEKTFVIKKPLSSPWRIMLPPEVVDVMGLRDGDTLVLTGMFDHVYLFTQEVYQRIIECTEELLRHSLKNDTDKEEE